MLEASHRHCSENNMPLMTEVYEGYIRALKSLRISHENLQEQILLNDEAADTDDESVESQLLDFVKDQFLKSNG